MAETQRIRALNVEIEKFKEFIGKFHLLFAQENFNYNILESQFEQIKARNLQLLKENEAIETKMKDSLNASDKIMADARQYEQKIKSDVLVLHHKADIRYKELQSMFDKAEKRQVEDHLKKLEQVAVAA